MYKYDKDSLKESLTLDQVYELIVDLGGQPQMNHNFFISKTICHNYIGEGSYKLYYYDNTKLFKCYTDCSDTFDIYELVLKVKHIANEKKQYGISKEGSPLYRDWILPDAIEFVAIYFGFSAKTFDFSEIQEQLQDWEIFKNYERIQESCIKKQIVELKIYDESILKHLPRPIIQPWKQEGITKEVLDARGIAFDPKNFGIVIPHYDINNNLIGIRERTLIKENEQYGKYRPAILHGQMYNHPLGFNLYNINNSKDNIKAIQKAIIFEGEKSPLLYASYFGLENDISVACCGSSLINYQVNLLLSLGVKEIIIAFDKQFREIGDDEWKRWTKKLKDLHKKYSSLVQITFMFDLNNNIGYKDSPIDCGKEIFLKMFNERVTL